MSESKPRNDGIAEAVKTSFPTLLFDVILPSADTVSDILMVFNWYILGSIEYATALLMPILANYIMNWNVWWRIETKEKKKFTWILVMLNIWTQAKGLKVIIRSFQDIKKAKKKKTLLLKEIGNLEPFFESIPSIFILTFCWVLSLRVNVEDCLSCSGDCTKSADCATHFAELFGDMNTFIITYALSIFSGAFGIAAYLKNGPLAVLPQDGFLDGIITWRFGVVFLTAGFSLFSKISFTIIAIKSPYVTAIENISTTHGNSSVVPMVYDSNSFLSMMGIFTLFQILPHLLLVMIGSGLSLGFNKSWAKLFHFYPSMNMLPIFTYLTPGPKSITKNIWKGVRTNRNQIEISTKFTLINMLMTLSFYIIMIGIFNSGLNLSNIQGRFWTFFQIFLVFLVCGILFNVLFCFLNSNPCILKEQSDNQFLCCEVKCWKFSKSYISADLSCQNNEFEPCSTTEIHQ